MPIIVRRQSLVGIFGNVQNKPSGLPFLLTQAGKLVWRYESALAKMAGNVSHAIGASELRGFVRF